MFINAFEQKKNVIYINYVSKFERRLIYTFEYIGSYNQLWIVLS